MPDNPQNTDQDPTSRQHFKSRPYISWSLRLIGALVTIIAILGIISVVADFGPAREQLYQWGLIPAFPAAYEDETLIVIATFHHSPGVINTEPHLKIRRAIQAEAELLNITHLRVEIEPAILTQDQRTKAEKIGNHYNASIIIWGEDTGVEVVVNFLNLKQPEFDASDVVITESGTEGRTQLANPNPYAYFITQDLPAQLTFLSLFAIGQTYYNQGAITDALATIKAATDVLEQVEKPPDGADTAYFHLGWLHGKVNENVLAITAYTKVIQLDPKYTLAYYNRGTAYADQGELEQAIADYDQAIQLDPQYTLTYNNRGTTYADLGELTQAIADYDRVIQLDPQDALAYYNRGTAYYEKGELEQAIADYDQAIQLDPQYSLAYYNRGTAHYDQGDLTQAFADYDQAIQLNPQHADAYYNRGLAYFDQGELTQAIADYDQAIQLNPKDADAYYNRGLAYRIQKEWDKAIADFQRYLDINPNAPDRQEIEAIITTLQAARDEP